MTDQRTTVYHEGRSTIQDDPKVIEAHKAKLRALFERAAKKGGAA